MAVKSGIMNLLTDQTAMKSDRIIISSDTLFGKPRIKGTRISVEQVLGSLAEGWSHNKIIGEFDITNEDINACIEFAYHAISRTYFLKTSGKAYA
jgi:uncharacterized protein (DUF433 family)